MWLVDEFRKWWVFFFFIIIAFGGADPSSILGWVVGGGQHVCRRVGSVVGAWPRGGPRPQSWSRGREVGAYWLIPRRPVEVTRRGGDHKPGRGDNTDRQTRANNTTTTTTAALRQAQPGPHAPFRHAILKYSIGREDQGQPASQPAAAGIDISSG